MGHCRIFLGLSKKEENKSMDMDIVCRGNCLIAGLSGELDQHMADRIRSSLNHNFLKEGITNIIFDFTEIEFMDSSGIGMILGRYKQVKKLGGQIYLTGCSQSLLRLVQLSGIERIVCLKDTIGEALEDANGKVGQEHE